MKQPFRALLEEAFSDEGVELPPALIELPPMSARLQADLEGAPDFDVTDPGLPALPSFPSFPPFAPVAAPVAAPAGPVGPAAPADEGALAQTRPVDLEDFPTAPLPVILAMAPTPGLIVRLKAPSAPTRSAPRQRRAGERSGPTPPVRTKPADRLASPFDSLLESEPVAPCAARYASSPRAASPAPAVLDALPVARGVPTAVYELRVRRGRPLDHEDDADRDGDRGGGTRVDRRGPTPFDGAPQGPDDDGPPRGRSLELLDDLVPFDPKSLPLPAPKPVTSREGVAHGEAQKKAHALYLQALGHIAQGEHGTALVHLKLATAYDPSTAMYTDLVGQLEKKVARAARSAARAQAGRRARSAESVPSRPDEGPALLVLSRDGSKRGAPPQAYWTKKR